MKNRWLINVVMLAMVVGIAMFLHFKPKENDETAGLNEVSSLKMADFLSVKVEFPASAPVSFDKVDGLWHMTAPYKTRADQLSVQRILSIIAAKTKVKLPDNDASKFGLDKPSMRLKLIEKDGRERVFSFGTYNPVTEEQYIGFDGFVYLLPVSYAESAATQPIEMIEKNPLALQERNQISGFDLSRLEQFASTGLTLNLDAQGKWDTSLPNAKPIQNELNEWFEFSWKQAMATSVELYTPNRHSTFPGFAVKLKNGKKVLFEKMQESPEYLIARPDEGVIYHFPNDVGFTMVNPPLNLK